MNWSVFLTIVGGLGVFASIFMLTYTPIVDGKAPGRITVAFAVGSVFTLAAGVGLL